MTQFILNDTAVTTELPGGMVILDFIRYHQRLTGTKIGCREGDCGACTVLVGEIADNELHYEAMTSCLMPLGNAHGKHVVSIEGTNFPNHLNPVQQAMADCGATQCGFCTPGFVMSLTGFCLSDASPTKENAVAAIDGNICRCTGYKSIERAAGLIAEKLNGKRDPVSFLTAQNFLPSYFSTIRDRLLKMHSTEAARRIQDAASTAERRHIVGGGTDLYVQKHDEISQASLRFLFDHPELNGIAVDGNKCIVGPSATVTDLQNSPVIKRAFPHFQQYAKLISSTPIRNMATIGGNFINASPIGDFTVFFLALDAQLDLLNPDETLPSSNGKEFRTIPLRKFYKGYKQMDKKPGEYIHRIWFELPDARSHFNFEKVSKRTHLDIASVNSARYITMNGSTIEKAAISAGGVAPIPMYLEKTSAFLENKELNAEIIDQAIDIMKTEISPISDARGSKEYKMLLLEQLIKVHLRSLQ